MLYSLSLVEIKLHNSVPAIIVYFLSFARWQLEKCFLCFSLLLQTRMEVAVEAGLCPTNMSASLHKQTYYQLKKNLQWFLWRASCAQTFQIFDLYATLFPLFNILSQVSFILNFTFERGIYILVYSRRFLLEKYKI